MISTPRIVYNSAHPMTVGMRGSVRPSPATEINAKKNPPTSRGL